MDIPFERLTASRYAGSLRDAARPDEPHKLLDLLLIGALIEARSCERFAKIAPRLPEKLALRKVSPASGCVNTRTRVSKERQIQREYDGIVILCLMVRRPPKSTQGRSSAASDVYKGQGLIHASFSSKRASSPPRSMTALPASSRACVSTGHHSR